MPVKILVVEDQPDSREILVTQLRDLGYEVIEAASGEEGVEKTRIDLPHVVIMDLGLPGINGVEATQGLKQNPETAHIPVIALTAWGDSFRAEAEKAGISEFLTKPAPRYRLQATIEKLLQKK